MARYEIGVGDASEEQAVKNCMGVPECQRHLIYLGRVESRFENLENVEVSGVSRRVLCGFGAARCLTQKNCPRETNLFEP